jgi:serine/threonine protein kinase
MHHLYSLTKKICKTDPDLPNNLFKPLLIRMLQRNPSNRPSMNEI